MFSSPIRLFVFFKFEQKPTGKDSADPTQQTALSIFIDLFKAGTVHLDVDPLCGRGAKVSIRGG